MLGFTNEEVNNIIVLGFVFAVYMIINLSAILSYYKRSDWKSPKYTDLNLLYLILLPASMYIFLVKYTIIIYYLIEPSLENLGSNLIKILEYKPFKESKQVDKKADIK